MPRGKEVNTFCPACGGSTPFAEQRFTVRWRGQVIRFLSARCKRSFSRRRNGEGLTWEPRTFD